ncbi:PAS domain-containing protein [Rubellimicrobium sp. CFH 75288]|uniref:PAS domain-containing protein n=1 Tax=Rubellimicrobium sp. CFH 75288 TaxID=2697034 RepID=UPI00141311D5|nr:PAS domain-containing protein [Rubellimicrobium sp. CFH 75288]NAZ35272.1 PAS domain-containing protein [Rubellimicrobium sp. CFH 75288]
MAPGLAFELAPVALAIFDREGRCVRLNRRAAAMAARNVSLSAPLAASAVWPGFGAALARLVERCLSGQAAGTEDLTGEGRTWRVALEPLAAPDGSPLGVCAALEDITSEAARRRLRDFLLRLDEALRRAPDGDAAIDRACALLGEELGAGFVGLSRIEEDGEHGVVEHVWRGCSGPPVRARKRLREFGEGRMAPLRRGETVVVEDVCDDPRIADAGPHLALGSRATIDVPLLRDGQLRGLLFASSPEPRHWTPIEVALVEKTAARAAEAAERVRAEAALRESEARFRQLAETVREVFYVFEVPEGRISYVSPAYEEVWGQPVEALYRNPRAFLAAVHPEDRPAVLRRLRVVGEGLPAEGEYRVLRPDGSVRHVYDRAVVTTDPATGQRRIIGLAADVTDRRLVEERLHLATSAGGMGIFDVDLGTGRINWDRRLREIWGLSPDETVTDALFVGGIHPDDRALMRAAVAAAIDPAGDGIYSAEYRVLPYGGGPRRWIAAAGRVHFAAGRAVRLIGTVRDVTARREAEDALRDSEERQRTLVAALSEIVWTTDAEGRAEPMEAWARLTGLPVEATAGHGWLSAIHPEDAEQAACRLALAAAEPGRRYVAEFRVRCADGTYRWFESRGVPIVDEGGQVRRWMGVTLDIDERKRAEAATAESEARFRTLANTLPALIFVATGEKGNVWVNDRFAAFTGRPREALLGRGWTAVLHPDDVRPTLEGAERSWRERAPYATEIRILRADGEPRWHLVRGAPVTDAAGQTVQWVGAAVEIQEIVEAREAVARSREAVERANAELEQRVAERTASLAEANNRLAAEIREREAAQSQLLQSQKLEALGQLTSGIAHDFNNVIAAIAGGFQVIERRSSDPRLVEVARHGARAARRGGRLVQQLLAFARQQVLDPRPVDPRALLDEALPLLTRSLGPGVAFEVDCPPDLPAVLVDPLQFETALINLAVNARDAMDGQGRAVLRLRESRPGEPGHPPEMAAAPAVAVSLSDTGCGMEGPTLERALEPFYTTKEPGRGTGLGLPMVHGFIRQSGGALAIESAVGQGTTVTLFLPLSGEAPPAAGRADERPTLRPAAAAVLLVDDDPEVRGVVAAHLADLGCRVTEAGSAAEALRRLEEEPRPDLVLTDVIMPGGDGVSLAEALRGRHPHLPVLFMTGHADRRRLAQERVLDKPFTPEALAQAIAAILAQVPGA